MSLLDYLRFLPFFGRLATFLSSTGGWQRGENPVLYRSVDKAEGYLEIEFMEDGMIQVRYLWFAELGILRGNVKQKRNVKFEARDRNGELIWIFTGRMTKHEIHGHKEFIADGTQKTCIYVRQGVHHKS